MGTDGDQSLGGYRASRLQDDHRKSLPALRPHLEAIVVEPDVRMAEVLRLNPGLVISGLPKPSGGCEIAWVEFRPYDESPDRMCAGERCTLLYEPGLDDLLSAVDEAERLS